MNIHGARRAGRRRHKACMGWSWAAACGIQGRGYIARLPVSLFHYTLTSEPGGKKCKSINIWQSYQQE